MAVFGKISKQPSKIRIDFSPNFIYSITHKVLYDTTRVAFKVFYTCITANQSSLHSTHSLHSFLKLPNHHVAAMLLTTELRRLCLPIANRIFPLSSACWPSPLLPEQPILVLLRIRRQIRVQNRPRNAGNHFRFLHGLIPFFTIIQHPKRSQAFSFHIKTRH